MKESLEWASKRKKRVDRDMSGIRVWWKKRKKTRMDEIKKGKII